MIRRVLFSGGLGAGKTTSLELLKARFACVDEPARRVLAHERQAGGTGTGDQDPARFISLMLDLACRDFDRAPGQGPVLFDRGLPDLLAYAATYGLPDEAIRAACRTRRYDREVLWFAPWAAIYETDAERTLDYAGAIAFADQVETACRSLGYELVPVPQLPPADRARWIADWLTRP
ncbi:MAG TPA: AAA family ATPase [Hyphomonas sp.]|nr:AAA family ATPase [Hyphomonas sp.]MCB9961999.1 AAA family ATPase [Hyphomonas sp.]MCB9970991.1 AAA family ATPase [Hyphomonas sp.]HPE48193.1 AAA family ATPase [Hyphomonas sp.]